MSEQTFNKVFQLIQECLVPKTQLEEYQNKILHLESMLQKANIEVEKLKSESSEQKLSLEITQAEKESLQAVMKAAQVKFKEVCLKLKQKTQQYNSLLRTQNCLEKTNTEKLPALSGIPNVKQEPIGLVNLPLSLPSKPNALKLSTKPKNTQKSGETIPKETAIKTGTKRQNTTADDSSKIETKRTKVEKSNTLSRCATQSVKNKESFTCEECLVAWGKDIEDNYQGDPANNLVPDPKQKIQAFTSFQAYADHMSDTHGCEILAITDYYRDRSNRFGCKICTCRFETKMHLDNHVEFEHANSNLTKRQFFDLYLKYKSDN